MNVTPDTIIFWQWQWFKLNATLVYTWLVMAILVVGSWLVTRNLKVEPEQMSNWQNRLEIIVEMINGEIRQATNREPSEFLPFVGTIFLFFALANILTVIPGYESPAASLFTTGAFALCVFFAVPYYGIKHSGFGSYLKHFIEPTPVVLPFNILSEITRTLSLAIRLFGNVMSTSLLVAIVLSLIPLFVPIPVRAYGIGIGVIQAYVFAILTLVYIASGIRAQRKSQQKRQQQQQSEEGAT
ncbi:F0F1 ATP synthase subunit A [Coleofasciculus sp.]|uniref:F0F1 ATP synthase subunit A n=1 Tax=Coleofasciculus sp. TaxID=3100458 RepID=UPI003A3EFBB2